MPSAPGCAERKRAGSGRGTREVHGRTHLVPPTSDAFGRVKVAPGEVAFFPWPVAEAIFRLAIDVDAREVRPLSRWGPDLLLL